MESTPVQLPGFGRPLNYYQKPGTGIAPSFPSALNPVDTA